MAKFQIEDSTGALAEVDVDLGTFRAAVDAGYVHGLKELDDRIMTNENGLTASQQVYTQMGLHRKNITIKAAMDMAGYQGASTQDNSITGRLVTQAFLMDTIENKLRANDYGILGIFNSRAAVTDAINGTKFERPILDFSRPEQGRSQAIAQLSEPTRMLLLTASDKSYRIAGTSIGIEYSDQAAASVSLPIVTLSMQRQAETEALERIEDQLLAFLNGDPDLDMAPLASVSGAVKTAKSFDPTLTAGKLSQLAWVSWLFEGSRKRQIDTIITDLKGALAIEQRIGRPTVQTDDATSKRIDTGMTILNPTWPTEVKVIISQDPNWPANTIVGFDSRYGYHVVTSTSLSYSATEEFAIRRSTKIRVDSGSIAYRLFDEAWTVMTLTD
jgi:hypothetical protein